MHEVDKRFVAMVDSLIASAAAHDADKLTMTGEFTMNPDSSPHHYKMAPFGLTVTFKQL